jgi:hypothetical protein
VADAFFFYGTLMDRDLLSQVLERRVWPRALKQAQLPGYRRRAVRGAGYPVVLRHRGASVSGVILAGVTCAQRTRLSGYEGEGYVLVRALAGDPLRAVLLFTPRPGAHIAAPTPWSLVGWRLRHKREAMTGAQM